jgi:hypothetical protein
LARVVGTNESDATNEIQCRLAEIDSERIRLLAELDRTSAEAVDLFISYAHEDADLLEQLRKQLEILKRQGVVKSWYDAEILPGTNWSQEIESHLKSARIILLLLSTEFLVSDYCYDIEMKRALERHNKGAATVIPVILRTIVDLKGPFE